MTRYFASQATKQVYGLDPGQLGKVQLPPDIEEISSEEVQAKLLEFNPPQEEEIPNEQQS